MSVGVLSSLELSEFHKKNHELSAFKRRAKQLFSHFSELQCDYTDWFQRRQQSFLDAIKGLQFGMSPLLPRDVSNMAKFKVILDMARKLKRVGRRVGGEEKLEQFISFWTTYCSLKEQLDAFLKDLGNFLSGIAVLREPKEKQTLDKLQTDLNSIYSETYTFTSLHNERDNLFMYRVIVADSSFLGFVGYLPYLIGMSSKICYQVLRIHIAKA